MSSLSSRVVAITGASSGIGRVTAAALAADGARVLLLGRNAAAHQSLADEIASRGGRARYVELDLSDLASVSRCARTLLQDEPRLDVLINNAGVAGARGLTAQGFELAFGVNHLGHYLLTELLLPALRWAGRARVINVSSDAHFGARGVNFEAVRRPASLLGAFGCYQVSKLCNVLHAAELARRYGDQDIRSYALHPGVIATDVWRHVPEPARSVIKLFMRPEAQGAETTLWCATSPELADHNGRYYSEGREREPSAIAQDHELAAELWRRSADWCAGPLASGRG